MKPTTCRLVSLLLACVISTIIVGGCKGSYSFTGASIPPNAKTISVATFPNYAATVNPQLSQKLTDELRNLYSSQTSLNVVNANGDLEVSGEITSYETRAAALSSNDEVSMNRLTITVKVKFVNNCDPDANFEQSFSRFRDYNAQLNFSSVESSLMGEIITELCDDIFNKSVVNW
ncbi:MAG: LptE family protein [Bacteroidales bacterium]|nr:LptE family protein [Bacteroidales bacterium]